MHCWPTLGKMPPLKGSQTSMRKGKGNLPLRIQCSTCPITCHSLWRRTWSILRRAWTIQNRYNFGNSGGDIENSCYIFIGDFVDRGYHSVETFEYLLCLKVKYPDRITLLRGNHESRYLFYYLDKSQQSMGFMIKSIENTEILILGNIVLKFLTTCPSEPSLMAKFFVFMEDLALKSRLSIKLEPSIEEYRCLMKGHSVI